MSFLMAKKFALKNLEIPFVLSSGIMFILFNIIVSLASNSYVIHRHKMLISIISMGIVIVGILAVIFVLYSVSVLLKRKNKTLALYSILGLEKKHIRKIISIEFMYLFTMILAIATVGGYIFGQLAFLGLNYLMRDMGVNVMHYPLSILAIVLTMVVVIILYLITVIRLSFTVYISTPTELLNKQHSGEGEPKSRYLVLLFGLITLSAGYWIALTTKGTLESITNFFIAVLLVIFATYALYVALTVVALKLQKKHSSYFKPVKFLSVSGLLYRIKSNALSLASIAILGSGVIVTLSAVTMIYYSVNMNFKNAIPRSYELISGENIDLHNYKKVSNTLKKQVEKTVDNKSQVVHSYVGYNCESWCEKKGDQLKILNNESLSSRTSKMLYVGDLVGYNANLHKKIKLQDDGILLC
ncbi:MAG: ABC transporter permease, partial [Lactobacillus iners]|nr:ABC transporter permease [Lactobacillus iners]